MPKKIVIIALLVIAIIAVTGAATYIVQQRQKGAEKVRQEEVVVTLLPDTADWNEYKNKIYGWSFKYPKNITDFSAAGSSVEFSVDVGKGECLVRFQAPPEDHPLFSEGSFEKDKEFLQELGIHFIEKSINNNPALFVEEMEIGKTLKVANKMIPFSSYVKDVMVYHPKGNMLITLFYGVADEVLFGPNFQQCADTFERILQSLKY